MPAWLTVVIPWSTVEKDSEAAAGCKVSWLITDVCHECKREHICPVFYFFSLLLFYLIQDLNLDFFTIILSAPFLTITVCSLRRKKPQKSAVLISESYIYVDGSKNITYILTLAQGVFTYHKLPARILFSRHRLCVYACVFEDKWYRKHWSPLKD